MEQRAETLGIALSKRLGTTLRGGKNGGGITLGCDFSPFMVVHTFDYLSADRNSPDAARSKRTEFSSR
jgi:hypothetical protein